MNNLFLGITNGFYLFGLKINFYGIISAFSYLLGVILVMKFAKKRGFKAEDILLLAIYVIPLCVIGARIYYVLFRLDSYKNFWDIFKIWEGGLGFYGGLIGGGIGVLIYCLIHKKNFFALADIMMPALILCQGIGRWGNFFNQEAYGYPVTNPSMQWFPFAVFIDNCSMADCTCAGSGWHLATFFYEFLWNVIGFTLLLIMLYRINFKHNGVIAFSYLVIYGIGRAIFEGLRTDSLYIGSLRVSQLLSIIFVVVGASYLLFYAIKSYLNKKNASSFDKIMQVLRKDL